MYAVGLAVSLLVLATAPSSNARQLRLPTDTPNISSSGADGPLGGSARHVVKQVRQLLQDDDTYQSYDPATLQTTISSSHPGTSRYSSSVIAGDSGSGSSGDSDSSSSGGPPTTFTANRYNPQWYTSSPDGSSHSSSLGSSGSTGSDSSSSSGRWFHQQPAREDASAGSASTATETGSSSAYPGDHYNPEWYGSGSSGSDSDTGSPSNTGSSSTYSQSSYVDSSYTDRSSDSSSSSGETSVTHPSGYGGSYTGSDSDDNSSGGSSFVVEPTSALQWDLPAGSSCTLNPAIDPEPAYCEPGMVCYPQHDGISDMDNTAGDSSSSSSYRSDTTYATSAAGAARGTQPDAAGVCARPHPGVLLPRVYPTPWPTPAAYFPLTQDLTSFPDGMWSGSAHHAAVGTSTDARWGGSLVCDAAAASYVNLDPVPYAVDGEFGISLWMKVRPQDSRIELLNGDGTDADGGSSSSGGGTGVPHFQYILSHAAAGSSGSVFDQTDQVALYLVKRGPYLQSVLRAVVRDENDVSDNSNSQIFLDSDGTVGHGSDAGGSSSSSAANTVNLQDGEWHHVVVSTIPVHSSSVSSTDSTSSQSDQTSGSTTDYSSSSDDSYAESDSQAQDPGLHGYRLYLDGLLRAEVTTDSSSSSNGKQGSKYSLDADEVPGGDPVMLTGPLTLCARSDRDPLRYFTGQVAHLQLFAAAIDEIAVAALYMEYVKQGLMYPEGAAGSVVSTSARGARCLMPISFGGALQYNCLVLPNTSSTTSGSSDSSTTSAGGGPSCITGPRGDWEACTPEDSSIIAPSLGSSSSSSESSDDTGSTASEAAETADLVDLDNLMGMTDASNTETESGGTDYLYYDNYDFGSDSALQGSTGTVDREVQQLVAAATGSIVFSYSARLPRFTLSGQACLSKPYKFQGQVIRGRQCATSKGREVCPVPWPASSTGADSSSSGSSASGAAADSGYDLLQCLPLVSVPVNSTLCYRAASDSQLYDTSATVGSGSSSSSGSSTDTTESLFGGCVVQAGLEFCKVAGTGGPWMLCPAGLPPQTLDGRNCKLTYKYGSTVRSDCTAITLATSSSSSTTASTDSQVLYCPPASGSTSSSRTYGSAASSSVRTADMDMCNDSIMYPATAYTIAVAAWPNLLSSLLTASVDSSSSQAGLPDSNSLILDGLMAPAGSGTRRYTLNNRKACKALPAGSSAAAAAAGGAGRSEINQAVAHDATPAADAAVCLYDRGSGQFACRTDGDDEGGGSSYIGSLSDGSVVTRSSGQEPCAPVSRTSLSGKPCQLPFTWKGLAHDNCVWHTGLQICPVAVIGSPFGTADAAYGTIDVDRDISSDSAVHPHGAWIWEACSPDYKILFQEPGPEAPGKRYTVSADTCMFPFVANGVSHWDCISGNSSTLSTAGTGTTGSGEGLSSAVEVCPLGSGEWVQCAAQVTDETRFSTLSGTPCAFPFAWSGTLHYTCIVPDNGTAGMCKDSTGSWQTCVAARTGAVSGRPCLLPLLDTSTAAADLEQSDTNTRSSTSSSSTGSEEATDSSDSSSASQLFTDCFWLHRDTANLQTVASANGTSGQQQQQQSEVTQPPMVQACYTSISDGPVLEECAASGAEAASGAGSVALGPAPLNVLSPAPVPPSSTPADSNVATPPPAPETASPGAVLGETSSATAPPGSSARDWAAYQHWLESQQQQQQQQGPQPNSLGAVEHYQPSNTNTSNAGQSGKSSNTVPVAVGVAVGVGVTLLLVAILGMFAVRHGWVYQWRSKRFHEMQLDPEMTDEAGRDGDSKDMAGAAAGAAGGGAKDGLTQQSLPDTDSAKDSAFGELGDSTVDSAQRSPFVKASKRARMHMRRSSRAVPKLLAATMGQIQQGQVTLAKMLANNSITSTSSGRVALLPATHTMSGNLSGQLSSDVLNVWKANNDDNEAGMESTAAAQMRGREARGCQPQCKGAEIEMLESGCVSGNSGTSSSGSDDGSSLDNNGSRGGSPSKANVSA